MAGGWDYILPIAIIGGGAVIVYFYWDDIAAFLEGAPLEEEPLDGEGELPLAGEGEGEFPSDGPLPTDSGLLPASQLPPEQLPPGELPPLGAELPPDFMPPGELPEEVPEDGLEEPPVDLQVPREPRELRAPREPRVRAIRPAREPIDIQGRIQELRDRLLGRTRPTIDRQPRAMPERPVRDMSSIRRLETPLTLTRTPRAQTITRPTRVPTISRAPPTRAPRARPVIVRRPPPTRATRAPPRQVTVARRPPPTRVVRRAPPARVVRRTPAARAPAPRAVVRRPAPTARVSRTPTRPAVRRLSRADAGGTIRCREGYGYDASRNRCVRQSGYTYTSVMANMGFTAGT